MRTVSQVQSLFKDRSLSKVDDYIRDRTKIEAHEFLKSLAPDASFLQNVVTEALDGVNQKAAEIIEEGIDMGPPTPEDLDDVCAEWSKHPFVMPSDEKVFHIRALQKKKERLDFKRDCERSVVDKSTFASRSGAIVGSERLKKQLKDLDKAMANLLLELKQAPPMLQTCFYHREKESLQEFVAKKREIFFVQMSLDTKRAEIRKLEERIFQREEALRKSEEMLEEDTLEFDAFLKKNDEMLQEAMKKADENTRMKQDKVLEIKKLTTETAVVKAELSKYEEQLEECNKYKEFLTSLTPLEWFEEQAISKQQREKQKKDLQIKTSELEGFEDMIEIEEEVTFFDNPKQVLQAQYKTEDEKQVMLRNKTDMNMDDKKHELSFEDLSGKVLATYLRCGMDVDPSLGTLQMLTMIEAKMEEGIVALKNIPPDFCKHMEKAREKERRLRFREENIETLLKEQEDRRIRSLERARAPIFKRIGKPPMFRSYLRKKKRKTKESNTGAEDDVELVEFLARDY
ncbi:hypothetical protein CY35_18G011300 [Sphagnum magellanicum]|nr:hypothetical protein CY35_18G011300 [Sphagnum magellanicum]